MEFKDIVLWHAGQYPRMTIRDYAKLAYQSAHGSEHMYPGDEQVAARLREEIAATPQRDGAACVPIGGGLCRFNLAVFDASGLRIETLAGMFRCAGKLGSGGLEENLKIIETLASENALPAVSWDQAREFLAQYRAAGCPAVHHSDEFRKAYSPAYRLIPAAAACRLELFRRMDDILRAKGSLRMAIDGMSASGKSTLGALLRDIYKGNLFHMDDYFLPPERKTPERLAESGGNVDRERFYEEIGRHGCHEAFSYRPFDCQTWTLGDPVEVSPNPVFITEGAYSLHPCLREGYDLRVFYGIDPALQSARILKRNGPEKHRRFINEWIPMENQYIDDLKIRDICQIELKASDEENFWKALQS